MVACVLNQFKSHWLLSNALQSTTIMHLKFKEKIINPSTLVSLINDDFEITFELSLFTSNIKREVCVVLDSFLSYFKKIEKKEAHNILYLMIDSRFKSPCLVSSFVGQEEDVSIVDEYDRRTLYPMFLSVIIIHIQRHNLLDV